MSSDDALGERTNAGRLQLWLLLEGNRSVVAGLVLATIFLALAVLVAVDPVPLARAIDSADPVSTLFQALVTGIVTGVTLVVTINQLVLSQELSALDDKRQHMAGSLEFRDDVAEHLDDAVSPADPAAFLSAMLAAASERARELRSAVDPAGPAASGTGDHAGDVTAYAENVIEDARPVREALEGAEFGSFAVTRAALDFEYASKIYDGKRLRATWCSADGDDAADRTDAADEDVTADGDGAAGSDAANDDAADGDAAAGDDAADRDDAADAGARHLGDEACRALDELVALLKLYGPAREHVKTLYFQWTLVQLSRAMLYSSVPALAVAIGALLTLGDGQSVPGATLGVGNESWLVLLGATLALSPFALLLSYVLRIATVAQRTLAIGPFLLRSTGPSSGDAD